MEYHNVAYCGLYCGACKSQLKGKCPRCYGNEKATWCEIRKCCNEHGYATCADCQLMRLKECKKYNNIFAKVIGFVSRTDRSKCIDRIKAIGVAEFAAEMKLAGRMTIKR